MKACLLPLQASCLFHCVWCTAFVSLPQMQLLIKRCYVMFTNAEAELCDCPAVQDHGIDLIL